MKVAVVGGGVVGLFVAHYLERAGVGVTVVDRDGAGGGCSAGNAGWICPSIALPLPAPGLTLASLRWLLRSDSPLHVSPAALPRLAPWLWRFRGFCDETAFAHGAAALTRLAAETLPLFDELCRDGIDFEYRRDGLLMVFRTERELQDELELLRLTEYEGKTRALSPAELADAEPALAPGPAGGLLVKPEWHVRPEGLIRGLATSLEARGVEMIEEAGVDSIVVESRVAKALRTDRGDVEADAFVLAAGAHTGQLAAAAGCPLPVEAGKGYSVTVKRPAVTVRRPLYLTAAKVAVTPFEGSLRVAGTMELSGVNHRMSAKRLRALERAAEHEVPGVLAGEASEAWVGMRPLTPDGLPSIGRLPGRDNIYVATGHQMLGMTLAPATGRALADLITTGGSDIDLAAFEPGRFA